MITAIDHRGLRTDEHWAALRRVVGKGDTGMVLIVPTRVLRAIEDQVPIYGRYIISELADVGIDNLTFLRDDILSKVLPTKEEV